MTIAEWTNIGLAFSLAIFTLFLVIANHRSAVANEQLANLQNQFLGLHDRVAKINDRIGWYTGALESHSELMMRMEAKKQGIPVVWWDPDIADIPVSPGKHHGEPAELTKIYQYLPRHMRQNFRP